MEWSGGHGLYLVSNVIRRPDIPVVSGQVGYGQADLGVTVISFGTERAKGSFKI